MKSGAMGYGPVCIQDWFQEDRIGYFDDETDNDEGELCGVVFIGDMFLSLHDGHHLIPIEFLRPANTDDLWKRRNRIFSEIVGKRSEGGKLKRAGIKQRYRLLLELAYIDGVLMDRVFQAQFKARGKARSSVFISHSSNDKHHALSLAIDLVDVGHRPWLDEWDIRAGESIPTEIGSGIEASDYVLVLLSRNSVESHWVEREWQAKYWKEVKEGKTFVIPVLIDDCTIPTLLQTKKYADFRRNYNTGLETLLTALKPRPRKKPLTRGPSKAAATQP